MTPDYRSYYNYFQRFLQFKIWFFYDFLLQLNIVSLISTWLNNFFFYTYLNIKYSKKHFNTYFNRPTSSRNNSYTWWYYISMEFWALKFLTKCIDNLKGFQKRNLFREQVECSTYSLTMLSFYFLLYILSGMKTFSLLIDVSQLIK